MRESACLLLDCRNDFWMAVARVGHSNAGRSVSLQDRPAGASAWATEATHNTGKRGGVAFKVTPSVSTKYRLSYVAVGHTRASKSGIVVVHVVTNPTALTVGALLFLVLFLPFVRFTRWLERAYAHPRS